jgi:hypothetical protein
LKKSYSLAICIVLLISVSFFCGLFINALEHAVDDNPDLEVDKFEIKSLENGKPLAKPTTIRPIDNGRPY